MPTPPPTSSTCTLRITEAPNVLTTDLDVVSDVGAVRCLSYSDAQLFTGAASCPSIYTGAHTAARLTHAIAAAFAHPRGRVLFAGCGTSGRLGHLISREVNGWRRAKTCDYLIAGDDAALLLPQESAEDRPDAGLRELEAWEAENGVEATDPVVVIGISCGLSATYVASILHACFTRPGYTAVALGFNPVESVQTVRVDGWHLSFYEVLQDMLHKHAHSSIVLNPTIGPEAVAGSSRMKGGSATKIILESCLSVAHTLAQRAAASTSTLTPDVEATAALIRDAYVQYELTVRHVYCHETAIAELLAAAAQGLCTRAPQSPDAAAAAAAAAGRRYVSPTGAGRLLYVGVGTAGLLGIVDASECAPTYGALCNAVRGWVAGGWDTLQNKRGAMAAVVPAFARADKGTAAAGVTEHLCLDVHSFVTDVVPTLSSHDLVVMLALEETTGDAVAAQAQLDSALAAIRAAAAAGARTRHVAIVQAGSCAGASMLEQLKVVAPQGVVIELPQIALTMSKVPHATDGEARAPSFLAQLACKLVLNATTTGAHVRVGTIYTNRMVNLMLTNAKLFHRAVGIVMDVTSTPRELAVRSVLRAIYQRDNTKLAGSEEHIAFAPASSVAPDTPAEPEELSFAQIATLPVSLHVRNASSKTRIVPISIMLALADAQGAPLRVTQAIELLDAQPIVRKALLTALGK